MPTPRETILTALHAEISALADTALRADGRDPLAPIKDAVTADGDVVVPLDAEAFGFWLKAAFGAPTTTGKACGVRLVEIVWRWTILAEVEHRIHRKTAQSVSHFCPITRDAVPETGCCESLAKARVPVEHGAAGVESQSLNAV